MNDVAVFCYRMVIFILISFAEKCVFCETNLGNHCVAVVIGFISLCFGTVMQSMPSALHTDVDFRLLQECGSQSEPLGSLRRNL